MKEPPKHLTPTEIRIANLVASGLSNDEISKKLFRTERTIKAHITSIFYKLGISQRTQLSRYLFKTRVAELIASGKITGVTLDDFDLGD